MPYYLDGESPNSVSPFRSNVVPDAPVEPPKYPTAPSFIDQTLPAAWHQQGSYMALEAIDDAVRGRGSPRNVDPNFNPLVAAKGTHLENDHDKLAGIVNQQQFDHLLNRERKIEDDKRTLAASGWPGTVAVVGLGLVDPGPWVAAGAFGAGASALKAGMAARGAVEGASIGAYEVAGHTAYDPNYTPEEAAKTMAVQTLIGGALGKGVEYLTKDELQHIIESQAVETGIQHYSEARGKIVGAGPEANRIFTKEELQAGLDKMPASLHPELAPGVTDYEMLSKGVMTEEELIKYRQYERDFQAWNVEHEGMMPLLKRVAVDGEDIESVVSSQVQGNMLSPPTQGEVIADTASAADVSAARNPDPYAATEGRTFEQKRGAFGSNWLIKQMSKISPIGRILNSSGNYAKAHALELVDTAREFTQSLEGVPTSAWGGSIERYTKVVGNRMNMAVRNASRDAWLKHIDPENNGGMLAGVKGDFNSLMKNLPEGKLGYTEFKAQIARALRSGDKNEAYPEAAEAAAAIRRDVINPLADELKTLKYADGTPMLDPEATAPKGDESFFSRVWNVPVIRARRQKLRGVVTNWLKEQQDVKVAAQQRIIAHSDREVELNAHLDKLEALRDNLANRMSNTNIRLSERSMAARDTSPAAERIADRIKVVNETIDEMQAAIDVAREDLKNPEAIEYIESLQQQISDLRKEAAPISDAEIARIEKEERDLYLSGNARKAARIVLGKQKMPEAPSFLGWIASEGGIVDAGGDLKSALGKAVPVGFYRKGRELFAAPGKKPVRGVDDWGEVFFDMAHDAGIGMAERPTPAEVLDIITDAANGNYPVWWTPGLDHQNLQSQIDWLNSAVDELGVVPKSFEDIVDAIRHGDAPLLARLQEKAQAGGEKGALEAALGNAKGQRNDIRDYITKQIERRNLKEKEAQGLRAGERGVKAATSKHSGRISLLSHRLEMQERLSDLTENAITFAEGLKKDAREALEKEIEAWQGNSAKEAIAALAKRREAEAARAEKMAAREAEISSKLGENGRVPPIAAPKMKRFASADKAVNRAIKRIIESDRDWDVNELADRADEIIDRIIGTPDGRFAYDIASPKYATANAANNPARGSLRSRDFAIPSNLVEEFLNNDVEHVMGSYLRTVLPDKELARRFDGDIEMETQMKDIQQEYADKINALPEKLSGRKLEKETTRLGKERDAVIRDLAAMRDRVRNTYGWTGDANEAFFKSLASNVRSYVTLTAMGSAPINSFTDFGGNAIMRHGIGNVFGDQYMPFVQALTTNPGLRKLTREQAAEMGIGIETALGQGRHSVNDLVHNYMPEDRFSYGMAMAADKFQKINMLGPWTDIMKLASFPMAQGNFMRLAKKAAAGKATQKEIGELANASISPSMAREIATELETHGSKEMGINWANTKNWTNRAAREAFENAVSREVDILVVTPGMGEVPLTMSTWWGSIIGQFKSFMFGANERVMIANLQRGELNVLQGLAAMTGLGTMSYFASQAIKGQDISDNPWMILKEGLDRGTVAPVINEVMKDMSKATGGRADPMSLLGAGAPVSRRAYNSSLADFMGPAFSTGEHLYQFGRGAAREALGGDPMTRSEIHHGRLGTAYQNVWWLRGMLDRVEDGAGDWMNAPGKRRHRAGSEY